MEGVYILAASSRPEQIDPALLRPGRIDKHVYLGLPDKSERLEILQIFGNKIKLDETVSLEEMATKSEGYTSIDLISFLKELRTIQINQIIESKKDQDD